jgi:hypothetical protein
VLSGDERHETLVFRPARARDSVAKVVEGLFGDYDFDRLSLHEADALSSPNAKSYGCV